MNGQPSAHETVLCDRCRRPLHDAVERWIGLCEACEELRAEWSDDAADEIRGLPEIARSSWS